MSKTIQAPLVLFVYQRPDSTKQILNLATISGINKIYLFADGPKTTKDAPLCEQVKQIVQNFASSNPQIECIQQFSSVNQGLERSIIEGLNHVFSREQAAIILEDDCLPGKDFFPYVTELLSRYENKPQVMSISGTGLSTVGVPSYNFSKYQQCWGWATWSRAWKYFDESMTVFNDSTWPSLAKDLWPNFFQRSYWNSMFKLVRAGQVKSWAFKWSLAHFVQGGLAAIPSTNLISNIGFDKVATNTLIKSPLSKMKTSPLEFPLQHPKQVRENQEFSNKLGKMFYYNPVAILGMIRQYIYYLIGKYAHRT